MGIEEWNLITDQKRNPAWAKVEERKVQLQTEYGLHPNTIKPYFSLSEIVPATTLCALPPKVPANTSFLTPWENSAIEGDSPLIAQVPKVAIFDIDGVLVSFWPALEQHLKKIKRGKGFSLNEFRESLEETKPSWTSLRPLVEMERRVDQLIFWTSRFGFDEDSLVWRKLLGPVFGDPGFLSNFPFLTDQKAERLTRFGKNTKVVRGVKGLNPRSFEETMGLLEEYHDPYIVYVGSSLFDLSRFEKIIATLREKELPFDRAVLLTNGRLIN